MRAGAVWGCGLVLLAASCLADPMEMCQRCTCHGGLVDCSSRMTGPTDFEQTVWTGIIQVEEFLLEGNSLVHLRPLPAFGTRRLSLRHNQISKLDEAAFRLVDNLTELDLGYNLLTYHSLTPHVFRGNYSPEKYQPLKDLKTLRLSGNIIHSLRSDLFEHLPNLKYLYLDSNPFKTIDLSTQLAIASVYYLEVLDMSSTMLSAFPPSVLHTPKYLRVLNFSSNHFSEVPQALQETHSLEELVLDDNQIITLRSFPEIRTLKVLRLNWMPALRVIGSGALRNLSRLEELHCSDNRHLREIAEDALSEPPLDQTDGETTIWPPLTKLYLRNNDLSYLDVNLVGRWDRLKEVDIQGNPWACDCENQWMLSTLIPAINASSPQLLDGIRCEVPPELEDVQLVHLSERKSKMRCLDAFGNQPEKDARLLVSIFICVIILIPILMAAIVILSYRMHRRSYTRNVPYKHIVSTVSS